MSRIPKTKQTAMNDIARSAEHYANTMLARDKTYPVQKGEKPLIYLYNDNKFIIRIRPGYEDILNVEDKTLNVLKRKALKQALRNRRNMTGLISSLIREQAQ